MTIWVPDLRDRAGPIYRRICDAIGADIAAGHLAPGTRLPPQRDLAFRLGVSLNTVTRGYEEAVKRGLLAGEVGRGTYVLEPAGDGAAVPEASLARARQGPIDFARNLPAPGAAAGLLATALRDLADAPGAAGYLDFEQEDAGQKERCRAAGADWIAFSSGMKVSPDEVVPTVGAQHGILAAMMAVLGPGDTLFVEHLTYAPIKAMARHLGVRIAAIPAGANAHICPDQLETITRRTGAKALFCTPTLHTPTARTLAPETRRAVAEVARRNDLTIIEDDVFGFLPEDRPPPLAEFAPERTIYVTGAGKCLGPGLRVGYVRAPERYLEAVKAAASLSVWMPPPLTLEIANRWIADGTARRLAIGQRGEIRRRQSLARQILKDHVRGPVPEGFHLWLELPEQWPSAMFLMEAEKRGVRMIPGGAFSISPADAPNAVRLCLSHEPEAARVEQGLRIVAEILAGRSSDASILL
ncbi:aminotransferase-like domain-containing protein [Nisaea sediminum]|uniref:aminotransferase-like domain-containing protein n=1 Tax=Nisaea sediminum TaxID=2775867 RepID=UPI001866B2EF|nr:PLP-dependent aminotransferase family protein [Nisaea sediminum]